LTTSSPRQVEEEFDQIADGKQAWDAMIAKFYERFHPTVVEVARRKR